MHAALDDLRDTFHAVEPGLVSLGRSLWRVRRSLDGAGGHLADLGRALSRDVRR